MIIISKGRFGKYSLGLLGFFLLSGCQSFLSQSQNESPAIANLPPIPLASHEFSFDPVRDDVVGKLQVINAKQEDTLSDIARRFNLGYEEIVSANPGVDPWLPGPCAQGRVERRSVELSHEEMARPLCGRGRPLRGSRAGGESP